MSFSDVGRITLMQPGQMNVVEPTETSPIFHLEKAIKLFHQKNQGYQKPGDPFANFKNSAPVQHGKLTPFEYAATLCAKQDDAVWSFITDPTEKKRAELAERLMDGIVYRAIMLALLVKDPAAFITLPDKDR